MGPRHDTRCMPRRRTVDASQGSEGTGAFSTGVPTSSGVSTVPGLPPSVAAELFFATDRTWTGAMAPVTQLIILVVGGLFLIPSHGTAGAAWAQKIRDSGKLSGTWSFSPGPAWPVRAPRPNGGE